MFFFYYYFQKQSGIFKESMIPEHVYPLGEDLFVTVTEFRDKISVHIRKYKKYVDTFYPSTEGVTLDTEEFNVLSTQELLPTNAHDIADLNMYLNSLEKTNLSVQLDESDIYTLTKEYQCRSGKIYKKTVNITKEQWILIKEKNDEINISVIHFKLHNIDFKAVFNQIATSIKPIEREPNRFIHHEIETALERVLEKNIYRKKGLQLIIQGEEEDDYVSPYSIRDFNESVMTLSIVRIVKDFENELNEKHFKLGHPLSQHLSNDFLSSVNIVNMIEAYRKAYCPNDPYFKQ